MESFVLKRGEARAAKVTKGQKIKIFCENGSQLADLVFLDYHQGLTLDNLRKFTLHPDDLLYDSYEVPVLKVSSIHSDAKTNILYPGCRRTIYKQKYKKDKLGCRELLSQALGTLANLLPSTINLFMDFEIISEDKFETRTSKVKAGDYNEFEVLKDTTIAVSACPCEPDSCRGNGLIRVEIK